MPNPNPRRAREAKAERRRAALAPVLDSLHDAVDTATALLDSTEENTRLKAVHAVSQAAVSYARVYEVGELEGRLEELEKRVEGGTL
jgi:hypothetical protein